jgi:hypothetical protein
VHGEPDASRWVHRIDYAFRDPEDTNDIAETVGQTLSWGFLSTESDWDVLIKIASWGIMASLSGLVSRAGEALHLEALAEKYRAIHTAG